MERIDFTYLILNKVEIGNWLIERDSSGISIQECRLHNGIEKYFEKYYIENLYGEGYLFGTIRSAGIRSFDWKRIERREDIPRPKEIMPMDWVLIIEQLRMLETERNTLISYLVDEKVELEVIEQTSDVQPFLSYERTDFKAEGLKDVYFSLMKYSGECAFIEIVIDGKSYHFMDGENDRKAIAPMMEKMERVPVFA